MRAYKSGVLMLWGSLFFACSGGVTTELDGSVVDGGQSADAGTPDAMEPDAGQPERGDLEPQEARTTSGVIAGTIEDGLRVFKGVPYAAAPVGALRFQPPQPHPGWSEALQSQAFGAICPQRNRRGELVGAEDCLSLNIWQPLEAPGAGEPKAVMVWIHGGAFIQGSSMVPIYDGARLAQDGEVVVVSLNYRLGALGFLATEGLIEESEEDTAGNYGLLDQIAALRWVQENIAEFGGDPQRVTIFGESAGGASVCALMGAPRADGLFHRAIIESGGGCYSFPQLRSAGPQSSAVEIGAQLVSAAGCDAEPSPATKLECMRALPAQALTEALGMIDASGLGLPDVGPTIDSAVIPMQPLSRVTSGAAPDVPVLLGSNADEAAIFTQAIPIEDRARFEMLVRATLGAQAAAVIALYPESEFPDPKEAYNTVFSDISFNCSAESFARAVQGAPAYLYYFKHHLSGQFGALGARHGAEIPFVFGTVDQLPGYAPTASDEALSQAMLQAWASFAKVGVPEIEPEWPAFDGSPQSVLNLESPPGLASEYRGGRCGALRDLGLVP